MTSVVPDFIDLGTVTPANIYEALRAVQGYSKFASILWIRALGEPTPDGIIIRRWSQGSARAVRAFRERHGFTGFLLRVDKYANRWSRRRGGYIIPAGKARSIVRKLSADRVAAALLEPVSPYRDQYSLASVTADEAGRLIVEVVGPGFDASDLLRGDLLPHERFEVLIPAPTPPTALPADFIIRRTYIINETGYARSVDDRLTKIGARLRNPAFPEWVPQEAKRLRADAVRFLRGSNETLLLRHAREYEPIPRTFVVRFVSGVVRTLSGLQKRGMSLGPVSFSATFTTRRRFVYWDFLPADTKKSRLLYLMAGTRGRLL